MSHEPLFVNFTVTKGGWIDDPPVPLDLSSCRDGPIFYVNEVVDKKVNQIWKWDSAHKEWVSVREGEKFHTGRDRILSLGKNRIPRLLALRHRRKGKTGDLFV